MYKLMIILSSFFFMASFGYANTNHCFLFDGSERCSLSSVFDQSINPKAIELELNDNGLRENYIDTLSAYYFYATRNNVEKLKLLHSKLDGSYKSFSEDIRQNPAKFSRFYKVNRVSVNHIYRFENYIVADVNWFDSSDKLLATWNEAVQCNTECFMSQRLLKRQDNFDLWMNAIKLDANSISVIDPSHDFEYSTNGNYPIDIKFKIKPFSALAAHELKYFDMFSDFLSAIKVNYETFSTERFNNYNNAENYLYGIFDKYWDGFNSGSSYGMPENEKLQFSNTSFLSMGHASLTSNLNKFDNLKPLGIMTSEHSAFLLVNASNQSESRLLIFAYSIDDNQLVLSNSIHADDKGAYSILNNPIIYDFLNNSLEQDGTVDSLLKTDLTPFIYNVDSFEIVGSKSKSDVSIILGKNKDVTSEKKINSDLSQRGSGDYYQLVFLVILVVLLLGMMVLYFNRREK